MCAAITLTLLWGCKGDEPVTPEPGASPKLTLALNEVEASAEGGRYTVNYTLENPKEGATLLVTPEFDWVSNISVATDGEISFDVAKSYDKGARSCRVDVAYPGVYPNATIVVRQGEGLEHSIDFVLQEVNATNIIMDIVPKDPNLSYVFILGNGSYIDENGLMADDEALWASDMDIFQGFAEAFGIDVQAAVTVFMYDGAQYGHRINGVSPDTKYVAYAYGFDVNSMTPTTEICRMVINTKTVSDYVVDFNLNAEVDGPNVVLEVEAVNYDGPFFFGLFDAKQCPPETPDEEFRSYCSAAWEEQKGFYSSFFDTPEQGLHFIFNELAYYDKTSLEVELLANTEYVLWAFGMDSEALINSTPERYYFSTGGVADSDNEFTVTFSDILSRRATITIDTTNDDPYVVLLTSPEKFEGTTDENIMRYILDNYDVHYNSGSNSETATRLTPSTEYELLLFGCEAGSPTTKLYKHRFTTAEIVYADLDFELRVAGYYDVNEIIAVDPSWAQFAGNDALVIVEADVDSEATAFYFSAVYSVDYEFYQYEQLVAGLLNEGAAGDSVGVFMFDYGTTFTFFGMAEDELGNFTEMYQTKPTTFTFEGRNDVNDFSLSSVSRSSVPSLVYRESMAEASADVMIL